MKLWRVEKIDRDGSGLAEVVESGLGKRLLVGKMTMEWELVF